MRIHSEEFKNKLKSTRETKTEINIIENGNKKNTITDDNIFLIKIITNGSLLKTTMKQLDLEIEENIQKNTILNIRFGLKINEEYEYIDYGNFVVYESKKIEETGHYYLTCYDKMLYSMVKYEKMNISYPITIRNYLNEICKKIGLPFSNVNQNFANYDKTIPYELYLTSNNASIGYTYRDVLDEIAQATGSIICINSNDELEIRYLNETNDLIDEDYLRNINVTFSQKYGPINSVVLSRSAGSDNVYLRDENSISQNGLNEIKISENQIMNFNDRSDYLPDLLSVLGGTTYYINDFDTIGICYLEVGDKYSVKIGDNIYPCLLLNNEIKISQGISETIYTDKLEVTETNYETSDKTDKRINQTYLIVDKQNQKIESVVTQTEDQNKKISQISQTVDEINLKISNVANITTSGETTEAKLDLASVNESEPINLVVRPINEDISNLLISSNMLISDNFKLKQRLIVFKNTQDEKIIQYNLPNDLLYYDSENYDEFYLNYDSKTCQTIKRVEYNEDGSKRLLDKEQIIEHPYPVLNLTDGDYNISIPGYESGYLSVVLMANNIYTTQFPTKSELSSEINQTIDTINLSVDEKLTNYSTTTEMNSAITLKANEITSSVSSTYATKNELSTTKSEIKQTTDSISSTVSTKVGNNEVISRINQSAEQITINANKLNLSGYLTISNANNTYATNDNLNNNYASKTQLATSGSTIINGGNIITGTIDAQKLKVTTLSSISSNLGTITGGSININNYFSVNSNGGTQLSTSAGGFLTTRTTKHPYVSAMNIGRGSGGLMFVTGNTQDNVGTDIGQIYADNKVIYISASNGTNVANYLRCGNILISGNQIDGNNDTYIRLNTSVVLKPNPNGGAYIWGIEDYNKILTVGGSPSTLSIKQNVRLKDTSDIPKVLSQIELYDYEYIDEVENGKDDYGYIIDYLEKIEGIDKYFKFNDIKRNNLKYKTINHEHLQKFLLGAVIELQKQINELRGESL